MGLSMSLLALLPEGRRAAAEGPVHDPRAPSVVALVVVLLSLLGTNVAVASNFGSTVAGGSPENQVSLANGPHHTVDLHNTTTETGSAILWAMDNVIDPTDMSSELVDGENYDVRVLDDDYGDNGAFAWVNCPPGATETGSDPNRTCKGQKLHVNLYGGYAYASDTAKERRSRACHELGHTVGLRHTSNDNSCMQTYGDPGAGEDRPTDWSAHDKDHVNAQY